MLFDGFKWLIYSILRN